MEALILIPVAFIIFGWIKATPTEEPPPGVNGFDYPLTCEYYEDDTDFNESNGFLSDYDDLGHRNYFDDYAISAISDTNDFVFNDTFDMFNDDNMHSDLFFDPFNSWYEDNVFHVD
jgi:hypothetical protein